jgi:ethanolamine utilization protein EutN
MLLGTVIGEIYSTINHPFYDGKKLMVVEKTTADGKPSGDYLIAIDTVGAGAGEPVLVIDEGNSARQIIGSSDAPLRTIIVGIVDEVARQ